MMTALEKEIVALHLPFLEKLSLQARRVIIKHLQKSLPTEQTPEEKLKTPNFNDVFGKWEDSRSAHEIIKDTESNLFFSDKHLKNL